MSVPVEHLSFRESLAEARLGRGFASGSSVSAPPVDLAPERTARANYVAGRLLASTRGLWDSCLLRLKVFCDQRRQAQQGRRLRVLETVPLGEKRFLAIVQVRDQEFLVGSSASGVSLLTRLDAQSGPGTAAAPAPLAAQPPCASVEGQR